MNESIFHSFSPQKEKNSLSLLVFLILVVFVTIGGFFLGREAARLRTEKNNNLKIVDKEKKSGINDKKTFPDQAEGILREGGIDGEGSFHLERPGGPSQNVYLTSSTIDLSSYVGKKVRVWGQTFAGKKAGWLMDVGLIEVIK